VIAKNNHQTGLDSSLYQLLLGYLSQQKQGPESEAVTAHPTHLLFSLSIEIDLVSRKYGELLGTTEF